MIDILFLDSRHTFPIRFNKTNILGFVTDTSRPSEENSQDIASTFEIYICAAGIRGVFIGCQLNSVGDCCFSYLKLEAI